jgi:anti-sigma factor RsiW
MCDASRKLVAWMDGELAENDASEVERHVRDCSECRRRVETYGGVSRLLVSYCDAAAATRPRRKLPRWVPALAGAVAVAAALLFIFRPAMVEPAPIVARAANISPAPILETPSPAPVKAKAQAAHRRHERMAPRGRDIRTDWTFADPDIQIAIPADAMFPPGAAPEGTVFRADLRMASDGSVQGLRLLQ